MLIYFNFILVECPEELYSITEGTPKQQKFKNTALSNRGGKTMWSALPLFNLSSQSPLFQCHTITTMADAR